LYKKIILSVIMIIALLSVTVSANTEVLYKNDFENGVDGFSLGNAFYQNAGYEVLNSYGNSYLKLCGGLSIANLNRPVMILTGDDEWTNYTFEFKAKMPRITGDTFYVLFGYQDNNNRKSFAITQGGAIVSFSSVVGETRAMLAEGNNITNAKSSITMPSNFNAGTWNRYRIVVNDKTASVYLNNAEKPFMMANFDTEVKGRIGLGIHSATYVPVYACFDDIVVTKN